MCAGDWMLIKGGEKYLLELTETSCLIWHKEVTHSSIFSSGLALVSTYRGLQTNKKLECWVPYGLKLHKDWNQGHGGQCQPVQKQDELQVQLGD
jgi:hypothetical protein